MMHFRTSVCALALTAGGAWAGGLDRSGQSMALLFEKGSYAELSFGLVAPDVRGTATATYGGFASGDMAADYSQFGLGFKMDLTDSLALALIYDMPFGADVDYPTGTSYYAQGTVAELDTQALTLVAKHRFPSNVSVFGGLRYQTMEAEARIPFVAGYTVTGEQDAALGYLIGAAYEKPEIALRVALTYSTSIEHALDTTEFGALSSVTTVETPQSLNLEFQSGIAKNTLLIGSIRWVDWSEFVIDPAYYPPLSPLVSYTGDYTSYSLGVGRKFNETWSGAVTLGYEAPLGGYSSNLGPSDGYSSIGVGVSYTRGKMKISAGARYIDVGKADVTLNNVIASGNFRGNSGVALGLKIGYSF